MEKKTRDSRAIVLVMLLLLFSRQAAATDRPYLDAALKAARWIRSSAIAVPEGIVWPADPNEPASVNNTLYAGNPGVILFFLELYYSTGDKSFLKDASKGADYLLATLEKETGLGLYEGVAGIGFALEETYRAAGEEKYRAGFLRSLEILREKARPAGRGIEWSQTTDIISGNAGIGLFIIYAAHRLDDRELIEIAADAGRRLMELGRPEGDGLKWAMDPSFPRLMPNFSHGTAGVAYYLATLYQETNDREFLEAAISGAKYLLGVAKTEGDICLIFHHEPDGKDLYYLGWCHGPVGTAQLFYCLYSLTHDQSWMNWLRKSARGISESGVPEKEVPGLWNNAGICCGLAGVGDFFLSLYRLTSEKSDLEFARRVAAALLQKGTIEGDKMKWIQAEHRTKPELLVAQTGLMQGAAGIGMFLLHLDALEQGKSKKINLPDSAFLN